MIFKVFHCLGLCWNLKLIDVYIYIANKYLHSIFIMSVKVIPSINSTFLMANQYATKFIKHYIFSVHVHVVIYGPLAPGLTSHWKIADDLLQTCAVSHPTCLGWGLFRSSIYEFFTGSCNQNSLGVSRNLLKFTCFW